MMLRASIFIFDIRGGRDGRVIFIESRIADITDKLTLRPLPSYIFDIHQAAIIQLYTSYFLDLVG